MRPKAQHRQKFIQISKEASCPKHPTGLAASAASGARKSISIRSQLLTERLEPRLLLAGQTYTWQNAVINGGGFVDGIFYDPHNANVIYARTDIGGLFKSVNDGGNWSQLLNWVGSNSSSSGNGTQSQEFGVLSFAIDPENSNNLYAMVGEYSGTNGDVLYSTNAGATWNTTPLSFWVGGNSDGRAAGERIAVDPYDSNIIILGSNANGIWESTNAGHAFTQLNSLATSASINFVYFDPYGGTSGSPTQTLFVGQTSTATGTNLYESTNGGTAFTQITGTGLAPTGWMPNRTALASDGNLYLAYTNAQAPNSTITNGGVFRYNITTKVWANISPVVPQVTNGQYDQFGYVGLALDPNSSTTLVVTSFDRYNLDDNIWRTTNANVSSPSWTTLYKDVLYQGYNTTRNTTSAPYMASGSDGIGNWGSDVAINPFNSAQIMHTSGGGIWATNQGNSTSTLNAPNSWYFPDTGIEMTAIADLAAANGGTPLYSAIGDIAGFAFNNLSFSPAQGNIYSYGNGASVDSAGLAPLDAAFVGNMGTNYGFYTTNGTTFTPFVANPGGSSKFSNGTIAESANGSTLVWAAANEPAYYSTNHGASWTLSTLGASGALPAGGVIVSDKVNSNYFYYWTENSSDNAWTLYISSNAGVSFTASAGGSVGTGNVSLAVNPYVAGQLWISSYIGLYESTNFGASFNHMGGYFGMNSMALGSPAPGQSVPAIYIYGIPSGDSFNGIYRSDDGGNTWLLLNSVSQQWGGAGTLAADPNDFGRVYVATEGILIGNPATSLPANWSDQDINEPGNPGWATSSTNLSTGTTVNQWNIVGGGAGFSSTPITISSLSRTGGVATAITSTASGLQAGQTITISGATNSAYDGTFVITSLGNTTAGLSSDIGAATEFTFAIASGTDTASGTITATLGDQFNFASEPVTGSTVLSAQINSITNADVSSGTPQAGVMYRASTNPSDPFFAVAQTTAGNLVLEYRTTTGGSITTQTVSGIPVGSEYVEIIRNASSFTGLYSSNGTTWTQIGGAVSITAMPATASAGLMATASYNPQLTDATFNNVVVVPTAYSGSNYYLRVAADGATEQIWVGSTSATGSPTYSIAEAELSSLSFTTSTNGSVTIDFSNGNPVPSAGVSVNSSGGNLIIDGKNSSNAAVINTSSIVFDNSAAIGFTNIQSLTLNTGNGNDIVTQIAQPSAAVTFNGGAGNDTLNISGGSFSINADASLTTTNLTINVANSGSLITFNSTQHLAALNLSAGGKAVIAVATSRDVLVTGSLSIANATLDLTDNNMIVTNGSLSTLSAPTSGIVSSTAASDTTHLTTVGVILNDDGTGHPLYGSSGALGLFAGQNPATDAVLAKFIYYGDANLDGKVDGTDYSRIDNGYLNQLTGWNNGDFNDDNVINGSDYTLIDNAFNTQGASLATAISLARIAPANSKAATRLLRVTKVFNSSATIVLPQNQFWTDDFLIDYRKRHPIDLLTSKSEIETISR